MHKILVVGDSSEVCIKIKNALEPKLPVHVTEALGLVDMCSHILSKTFNLVIVSQEIIDSEAMKIIEFLKKSGGAFPILLVTNKINQDMSGRLRLLSDLHMLIRPILDKSLIGLARKLLQARRVPKQNYRRFNTNQLVEMETLGTGEAVITSMYNLSKGGAYCEFESKNTFSIGEVLRLKIFLSEVNSNYAFTAKVVWTTTKGRFSGRYGCGFKFLNSKENAGIAV